MSLLKEWGKNLKKLQDTPAVYDVDEKIAADLRLLQMGRQNMTLVAIASGVLTIVAGLMDPAGFIQTGSNVQIGLFTAMSAFLATHWFMKQEEDLKSKIPQKIGITESAGGEPPARPRPKWLGKW